MLLPAKPQIPESRIFISPRPSLLAARFNRGNSRQIGGQIICLEVFDVHFDQANKGAAKVSPVPATSIDDHRDTGHNPTVGSHNLDRFLDPSAARDHILGHDEPFVRALFDEYVSLPQGASHFLTDDDPAQGGRNHRIAFDAPHFVREPGANIRRDSRVLEDQSALKKLPAMQARPQDKMPVEECARLAKKRKQIVAHWGSADPNRKCR